MRLTTIALISKKKKMIINNIQQKSNLILQKDLEIIHSPTLTQHFLSHHPFYQLHHSNTINSSKR